MMGKLKFILFGVFLVTFFEISLSQDGRPSMNFDRSNFNVPENNVSLLTTGASVHSDTLGNAPNLLPDLDDLFLEESNEKSVPETNKKEPPSNDSEKNKFSDHDNVIEKSLPDIDELFNGDATDLKDESTNTNKNEKSKEINVSNVKDNDSVEVKIPEVDRKKISDMDFKEDNEKKEKENKEKQGVKDYVKSDLGHDDTDVINSEPKDENSAMIQNSQLVKTDKTFHVKPSSPDQGKKANADRQQPDIEVTADYVDKQDGKDKANKRHEESDKIEAKNDETVNTKSSSINLSENKHGETDASELFPELPSLDDIDELKNEGTKQSENDSNENEEIVFEDEKSDTELPSLDDIDELKNEGTKQSEKESIENEEIVFDDEKTVAELPSLKDIDDLKSEDNDQTEKDIQNIEEIRFDNDKQQYDKNDVKLSDSNNEKMTEKESKDMDKTNTKMVPSKYGDSKDNNMKAPTSHDIENSDIQGSEKANKRMNSDTEKKQQSVNIKTPSSTVFVEESKKEHNIQRKTENDSLEKNESPSLKDFPEEGKDEDNENIPEKTENDSQERIKLLSSKDLAEESKEEHNGSNQKKIGDDSQEKKMDNDNFRNQLKDTDNQVEEDEDDEAYTDINDEVEDKKTEYIDREGEKVNEDDERPEEVEPESHDADENYDTDKWSKSGEDKKGADKVEDVADDFEVDEIMKNSQNADVSRHPTAPSSMVLLYTWMIVAVLIVVVGISTYQSRCKGLKIPFFSKKTCHGDDKKRLLDHEFV